jgi:hypothetical protein
MLPSYGFFPSRQTWSRCSMYTSRGDALAGAHAALRDSQERVRRSGGAALTLATRMQRLHSAAAYFCRVQRRQLFAGSFPRPTQRHQRARPENVERRKTAALHTSAWAGIPGQENSVCPCGQHGAPECPHPAPRTRDPALDGVERGRTRRAPY